MSPQVDRCSILELRQYTLHEGKREVLIELFDRALIDGQESLGMRVIGQFRDLDRADHFVWLRGFSTMDARKEALGSFYGGPIWKAHREAANATMIDSDDVLLLRPVEAGSGFSLPERRPGLEQTAGARASSSIVAHLYFLSAPVDAQFISHFKATLMPILSETGAPPIALFQTEAAENTFPALPVRTGENVFIWFAAFDTPEDHRDHLARIASSNAWSAALAELSLRFKSPPQTLRLEPTLRSLLGHPAPTR